MSEWQRCPICAGRGVLNYPPGTPIGQDFSSTSTGPWPCERCNGDGIIKDLLLKTAYRRMCDNQKIRRAT